MASVFDQYSRSINEQNWSPLGPQSSSFQVSSSRLKVDSFAFALRVPLVTLRAIGLLFLLTCGFPRCHKSHLVQISFSEKHVMAVAWELTTDSQVGLDECLLFSSNIKGFFDFR